MRPWAIAEMRPWAFVEAMRGAALSAAILLSLAVSAAAAPIATNARQAILIDYDTGAVLFAKEPDEPVPPASMVKLMTVELVFEALQSGRLTLDDVAEVSESAFRKEGSTMFLNLNDRVRVEDLIRGVIVQSGNDASIALAELLAGTERAFADRMTRRGREIGLRTSIFTNSTGLPDPEMRMSVRDLALLSAHLIRQYPEYYHIFAERSFKWETADQPNRNSLLYLDIGADGLKTGHTDEAGFGIAGSAIRDGRRLVTVVTGLGSERARTRAAERLLSWGFREFRSDTVATAGQIVGAAEVWIGAQPTVPLVLKQDLVVTRPFFENQPPKAMIVYDGPIEAPIEAGARLATLRIEIDGLESIEAPLHAAEGVARGGYLEKLSAGAQILLDQLADAIAAKL